ncbi:MAG: hypothetical protein FWH12_02505 [Treponema sp.]|nr:hypothetical protein [Treponema sp.]
MNDKAQRVIEAVEHVIAMEDVQPGYPDANGNTNTTWCNRALHRVLVMLGAQADLILEPKGINWTTANRMVLQARATLGRQLSPVEAQCRANDGLVVIAMAHNPNGSGHVETVLFDTETFRADRGCRVGGAGKTNGIGYVRPRFANLEVEYYIVPPLSGGTAD